jgi:hypothetical protein
MKIGIVTMPLHANYGGILQNYALQTALRRLGHEPITLREKLDLPSWHWSKMTFFRHWCISVAKWTIKSLLGRKTPFPLTQKQTMRKLKEVQCVMNAFVEKHINCTEPKIMLDAKEAKDLGLEALVVGSDQVWRPKYVAHMMDNQMLGFAKDMHLRRISYAASFGVDSWEYSEEETKQSKDLVSLFDAISVREPSAIALVKENWNMNAEWVLDPTMLLSKEDYVELCKDIPVQNKPFVFAYILSANPADKEKARIICKQMGYEVKFLNSGLTSKKDTVEQWLSYFRDAKYVITDSFHGTVFSLLFEKDFICFDNAGRGSSRIDGLKRITGLEDCFTSKLTTLPTEQIDYRVVNERIEKMREKSLYFLKKNLS